MIAVLCVVATLAPTFECSAYKGNISTSGDGSTRVIVTPQNKILVYRKGSKNPVVTGWSDRIPHHTSLFVSQKGDTFALLDDYNSIQVFDKRGFQVGRTTPEACMSEGERRGRPGKWACHPEGTWVTTPEVSFKSDRISFRLYNGRKVEVALKK
jgi:hypothetical protein